MSQASPVEAFLQRADAYAERAGRRLSYVSRQIFNDGKRIDRLRGGGGIQVDTLERAHEKLQKLEDQFAMRGDRARSTSKQAQAPPCA